MNKVLISLQKAIDDMEFLSEFDKGYINALVTEPLMNSDYLYLLSHSDNVVDIPEYMNKKGENN